MNKYKFNFNNFDFKYYLRDDVDFSVFNEIFKINEYKSSIDVIKNAKFPIIDIGAHVGFFSIFASCLNSNVSIYSIEPEKSNFELLEQHKNENKLLNIKTFKCAIEKETKNGELLVANDSINHNILKIKNEKLKIKNQTTQDIRIFSLKDFFDNNKIEKVSLIKMDIEGGEYDILENVDSDICLKIGAFIMEYHNLNLKTENLKFKNKEYLETMLRENGFSVQVFPSKFDKDLGFIFAVNKRFKQ